jgi:transposase-like protein
MTDEDYPLNQQEFEARFSTEDACLNYLFALRWPDGFVCPRCTGRSFWRTNRGLIVCSACQHQASVTAGTIFQDTRKPLQLWFRAAWFVTQQKHGASALGLQRALGLGGYLTAWTWLHKFRRAMVRPNRDRLSGWVEVDETFFGGLEEGHRGRDIGKKALIAVAAEADGKGIGRVRMSHILDASGVSLNGFVENVVTSGATIHTDGWSGYSHLAERGYKHVVAKLQGKPKLASKLLPRVHRVISLFKRWMLGTHQGAVSHEHLAYYLDEFTFRFNRRKSKHRGKLFFRLLQQAVEHEPAPYKDIAASERKEPL